MRARSVETDGLDVEDDRRAASTVRTSAARIEADARLGPGTATPQQLIALQRTIGNANVNRLLARGSSGSVAARDRVSSSTTPVIQRSISFDGGTTIEPVIPDDVLREATLAGPAVLSLLKHWFEEPLKNTVAKNWAELLANAKSMAPTTAIDWGDPKAFDAEGSDSDSEAENKRRDKKMFGPSVSTVYSSVVFNYTKKEGRKTVKGKPRTHRQDGKRVKPRVDNRVYRPENAKGLAADATKIHDVIPKEITVKSGPNAGERRTNQSFGATTVVCAVFRRVDGQLRKLCCSNANGPMAVDLRKMAEQLGYHVIRAEQAHAEGEMLQYLNERGQVYSLYAMGCDKEHCKECDWAMRRTLGDYPTETAKSDKTFPNYYIPPAYARVLGQGYTFDNSPQAMARHQKEPPKKRRRINSAGASKPTK